MKPFEFLQKFEEDAKLSETVHKVPWKVTLAQAALESSWGLRAPGNNFFGIKANESWHGGKSSKLTKEFVNGKFVNVVAEFRSYATPYESFVDHGKFITSNPRYLPCFTTIDPKVFARHLQTCGYATDPQYANKLISIMEHF